MDKLCSSMLPMKGAWPQPQPSGRHIDEGEAFRGSGSVEPLDIHEMFDQPEFRVTGKNAGVLP
jgi:hypothetical protein